MIEIAPNIYYLPGKNKSRFPYCACLYIKGRDKRVLIDAGMGSENMAPVKKLGIDLLILTHCHIDHRLTRTEIADVPVWCHEKEEVFLQDRDHFFTAMGLKRSGLDLNGLFDFAHGMFGIEISHRLTDGDRIDLVPNVPARDTLSPLLLWFEHDVRFDHGCGCGVQSRLNTPNLS